MFEVSVCRMSEQKRNHNYIVHILSFDCIFVIHLERVAKVPITENITFIQQMYLRYKLHCKYNRIYYSL